MLPGLTSEEARDLVLSVGTHSATRRLTPIEVAELFQKATRAGATADECARFVGLTTATMVTRFLKLLKLSERVRHAIDWGQTGATVSFASAQELAVLNDDEQGTAAEMIMSSQLTKDEVRQASQLRKRSSRSMADCITEVLRLRPSIVRKHVFLGAVTHDALSQHLSRLDQAARDRLMASVLAELYGALPRTSARLGVGRFTIVTDEEGAAQLRQPNQPSFESAVNQALLAKVSKR